MNPQPISPDDPRLTAYALNEMAPAERAEFEALLAGDPAAGQLVGDIRALAGSLEDVLTSEPLPAVTPLPVSELAKADQAAASGVRKSGKLGRVLQFPQLYFVIPTLAAACFLVMYLSYEPPHPVPAAAPVAMAPPPAPVAVAEAKSTSAGAERMEIRSSDEPDSGHFVAVGERPEASFPLQVGHESYAVVRAQLRRDVRPAPAGVQVAEMVNAFTYHWPAPAAGEAFAAVLEEAAAPWAPDHRLVRIGLKGRDDVPGLLAQDAQVKVAFNPARVHSWRLIGYGRGGGGAPVPQAGVDLQPGVTVTALFEIVPTAGPVSNAGTGDELLRLALNYSEPGTGADKTLARVLPASARSFEQASADFRFAAAVAAFGAHLQVSGRGQPDMALAELQRWARESSAGEAERVEFANLIGKPAAWH